MLYINMQDNDKSNVPQAFNINNLCTMIHDSVEQEDNIRKNQEIQNYNTTNLTQSDHERKNYINSLKTHGLYQSNSKDVNGLYVNGDSDLKNGKVGHIMTSHRSKSSKSLDTSKFLNSPFLGSGETVLKYPDLKSKLLSGEDTFMPKSCDTLSGVSIDRFTPLVPCLEENVQDTTHIIPEYWVRGGMSTRNVIRNIDYMRTCGLRK